MQPNLHIALAPMDGITDQAYRRIVRRLNPGVWLYSEFASVNGITHSERVKNRIRFEAFEQPLVVQLFGNEPALFAQVAQEVEGWGPAGINLNFGCPAKRVVGSGSGAALIKNPDLAFRIVEATKNAVKIPVCVKTRLGWSQTDDLIPFVQGLQNAGADRLILHGRTAKQAYGGQADWNPIYEAKRNLHIPVIGNGDLQSLEQGHSQRGNLDGFMIGRAALGNPWVFWPQAKRDMVTLRDKVEIMLSHLHLILAETDEPKALMLFRKHVTGYLKGFSRAKEARMRLMEARDLAEFTDFALGLA